MFSKIFKATINDVPELVKLVNSAYRGEDSKKGWTTEADYLDGIRIDEEALTEIIEEKNSTILKYMDDDVIVGCVYLKKQDDQLYLGMLTVSPDIQAKGIGKQLLQAAEDFALQQNCTSIVMNVISERKELINWYNRHGYKETGITKPFPSNPRFGTPKIFIEFSIMEKKFN